MMMQQRERTRRSLIQHDQNYPRLQTEDVLKFLHQSAFGCEHLASSLASATASVCREYAEGVHQEEIVRLDGAYSRVPLSYLDHGLDAQTLAKLFMASAKNEPNGKQLLENKLDVAQELVRAGKLPFSPAEFERAVEEWKAAGFPAVHHSDEFRRAYRPAYRVISNDYLPFLPLLAKLDQLLKERPIVVAVEGGSASGKTTVSARLAEWYDANVFHMDDFFLRPEQRTPERYREVGGNLDRERFLAEVLIPLSQNEPIRYRRFDCSTMTMAPPVTREPKRLTIVEGVYSMHPAFSAYYDVSVFLDIPPALQKKRIETRNTPPMAQRFFREWIPLEQTYFKEMQVKQRCDLSVSISE